jgi:hypothetical protein
MEHTHLLGPHKHFQRHSIHMCRENEFHPKFTQRGVTSEMCSGESPAGLREVMHKWGISLFCIFEIELNVFLLDLYGWN